MRPTLSAPCVQDCLFLSEFSGSAIVDAFFFYKNFFTWIFQASVLGAETGFLNRHTSFKLSLI
jgi:hypothetical protein